MASKFIGDHHGNGANLTSVNASSLEGYDLRDITPVHSGSDFTSGTLITTDIPATVSSGASFVMEISGKGYGARTISVQLEGYLYNNTIINYDGIDFGGHFNVPIVMMEYGGNLCFWWARMSYWQSFNVHVRDAGGDTRNRVTSITNSTQPAGNKVISVTLAKSWTSANDGAGSGLDADLVDGIQASSFVRNDTANNVNASLTFNSTNYHSGNSYSIYGPNATWSRYLNVGGNGYSGDATHACVATTNGNLHLDSSAGASACYLNWYGGTSGTYFGNGASVQVGRVDGAGTATFSGDVTAYSDARLKTDVEKIEDATAKVEALNGVTFTRTTDDNRSTGLIAQEVLAVLPEAVNEDDEGFYSVKYGNIVGLLVEAIKEQNARIQELENKLNGK